MQVITKLKLKMRTKHILTAMVLPALLAACTADEFETTNGIVQDSQRAMLSEDFRLKIVEDADTRYAVDEENSELEFTYESGDQIGAAIIDNPSTAGTTPDEWDIIQRTNGLNWFTFDGTSEWASYDNVGEGHYIFTYPRNPNAANRYAVAYELPVIQKQYDANGNPDETAAIKEGNQAVFSTILYKDDKEVSAVMRNLFAYPKFRINFDNGEKVTTVSKVVLELNKDNGFVVKSGLDHKKVYAYFSDDEKSGAYDSDTKVTDWSKVQTASLLLAENEAESYIDGQLTHSKYIIAEMPENTTFGIDNVTNNKYVDVRFMIPGELLTANGTGENVKFSGNYAENLKMHIYTDNGIYTIENVFKAIDFSRTTEVATKERVFARNTSFFMNLMKSKVEAGEDNYLVTTVEDWNNLVADYGSSRNYTGDNALPVSIIGDEFAFNAETEFPSVAEFKVNTPVKVEGNVTISNVTVNDVVTVEEGATLTTSATFVASKGIENNGTLNIAPAEEENKVVNYNKIASVINYGTLNVQKEAIATLPLLNMEEAVVENNGEITISNITVDSKTGNYGTINNNGTINTVGFTNAAREYADDYEEGDEAINTPTINNNKGAKILAKDYNFVNNALIVNKGTITCRNEAGKIQNKETTVIVDGKTYSIPAEIDAKEAVLTYITANADGKIIVASATTTNLTIGNGEEGIIELTTANASEYFKNSLVNSVIASKDFELKDGDINTLTLTGDAKLTLDEDAEVDAIKQQLNVEAGTTTLASDITVVGVNVAKGAQITVPEDITMKITGGDNDFNNDGVILVGGVFEATGVTNVDGNGVEDNGNGEITWAPTSTDKLKSDYEEALKAAIKAWASDANTNGDNTLNKVGYDILDGQTTETPARKAAAVFEAYYTRNASTVDKGALTNAFNAYKAVVSSATLTGSYDAKAAEVVSENEKSTSFQNVVKDLTWTVSTGSDHIYKDTPASAGVAAKTAAQNALEAFQAAVADGAISVTNTLDKVTLCSSSMNYAPACSQVFVTDAIYTIFGEDAIALTQDWKVYGFTYSYKTEAGSTGWGLNTVKTWISDVAGAESNGNLYVEKAKQFVEANNLISVSKSWTYDDKIIQAIVNDQEYNRD